MAGRSLVALPLLVALGLLTLPALWSSRADVHVSAAHEEMDAWTAARLEPQEGTWDSVRDRLQRSLRLVERNPTAHELLGHLFSRRADSAELMALADVHFARALELRPVSPYTWAALAEAQYRQGKVQGLFETALQRAAALGPAEPGVQRMVAFYGLAVWDEVGESTRKSVEEMVAAGMRRNPPEMMQIAGRRGRLQTACRHLPGFPRTPDPKWLQSCQSTEATS